jgi:hypothetical protein
MLFFLFYLNLFCGAICFAYPLHIGMALKIKKEDKIVGIGQFQFLPPMRGH